MTEVKQIALPKPKRAVASLDPTKLNIHNSSFNVSAMREKRKRSRQVARFIGPLLDGSECKKEENFNPYIQPYTGGDPYCVMVPPKTKNIIPLTEEGLDDWFAQSQNRKIESLVLAKKDFFVPHVLTDGVRGRWLQKPRPFVIPTSELQEHQLQEKKYFSLYHDQEKISPRLLINEPTRLLFEYSKLVPKNAENGTAVKIAFRPRILGRLYDHAGGQRHKSSNSGSPSRPPRVSSPKRSKLRNSSIPQEEEESSTVLGPEESISNDRSFSRSHLGVDKKNGSFGNVVTNAYYQNRVKKVFGSQRGSKEGQMMNEDWILESGSKRSEILKEEELVKESEEFLAQLIVRIKKQKEEPASLLLPEKCMTPMNAGTLGDAGLSGLSSNRISRRFSRLNSNNTKVPTARSTEKKPAAEIMSLSVTTSLNNNNRETVELFSRLRQQLKGDFKRQIDEKKLRKILPLEQQHELSSSEPRSASTRYGSIRTPFMHQQRPIDSMRDVNPLLSRSINASPMGSVLTPKSIKIPQRRDLSLDMGASINMGLGSQLNSHAKETLSNKFFDQLLSPRSSSVRYEQQQLHSAGIHHHMEETFGKSSRNSTFRNSFNNTNKLQTILSSGGEQPLDSIARSTLRSRSNSRQKGPVRIRESAGKQVTIDFKTTSLEFIDKETLEFEGDIDKKLVNNTQFWFVRGTMQMNNGNYYNAIDCFKQILVTNPQYYIGIFNIGCMYERLGKLDLAKKWLQLSYDMDFYKMECIYGFALCAFKAGEFQQCYDYLLKLEINNPEIDVHVYYLTALCCKELLKFEEASICYHKVNEAVKNQACAAIAQKVLTKLFFKYRKTDEEAAPTAKEDKSFMEDSVQILHEKSVPGCIFDHCITSEKEWKSDSLEWVTEKLSTLEFWKRFPIEYLRTFLGYIQVEKFNAGNVIYLKKGIVYVIISGSVWLKDHSEHFLSPKVMSHLREGDIIGYDTIDNNIYCQVENWLICHSNVEVWSIKKVDFENIWEAQKTLSKNVFADSLYDTVIFKRTAPQTLFKLAYDMSKREVHQAGRIIYNDNSYIKASEFNAKIKHKVLENKQLPLATLNDTITIEDSVRNTSPVNHHHHTVKEIPRNKSSTIHPVKGNLKMEKKDNSQASLIAPQSTSSNYNPTGYKFPPTTLRGIFIILSGECHVENHNGHIYTTLTRGEFFGENLLLETKAYNNFGLIKCKTAVETLFIPQSEFWRIPRYELEKMHENCANRKGIRDLIDHHHHHNNGNQHQHPHHVKISRRSAKDLSHLNNRS